jgi:hypothetical protein
MNHGHRFLFLDDEHITRLGNLRRVVNPPTPHPENPVFRGDRAWEKFGVSQMGTVLFDEKENLYKFWYLPLMGCGPTRPLTIDGLTFTQSRTFVAYATSKDGVHWDKPSLGQVEFEGSKENNLLKIGKLNPEGISVLYEPDKGYKAFYWEHGNLHTHPDGRVLWSEGEGDGMWVSFSPDGIHWTNYENNPVGPYPSDTGHYVVRDPSTGNYMAYGRFGFMRNMALMTSEDFYRWTRPELIFEPDDLEEAGPAPATQFYGMSVDIYEGLYLGGLWIYREGTDGKIDTQLAVSRDGVHWNRVADRQVFLPLEPEGSWGSGMIRSTARYITRGDKIYIYYGVIDGPHGGPNFPAGTITRKYPSAISLGILRRDGFVSLDAGTEEGTLLTKPIWLAGRPLHLNVDVRSAGSASVSVCHWNGQFPLQGFEKSIPITTDATDTVVRWSAESLEKLSGQCVRLKIQLRNAKLFSFWFD